MLSFILSFIVVILHFSPVGSVLFVGSKLEGLVAFIMIPLWSALVAVISDAANGLAVDAMGTVSFGNLYYFGWAGFVCAIMLFLNFMSTVHRLDVREELRKRSDRLNLWVATLICSLVLMSSSANIFDYYCVEKPTGTMFCNRSLLAILMGSVASISSIIVIGMKLAVGTAPFGVEVFFATGLFLANCFSLGLVTSERGPGAKAGNLYYFSWLSLVLPFLLLGSLYDHYGASQKEAKKDLDAFEQTIAAAPPLPHYRRTADPELPQLSVRENIAYEREAVAAEEGYARDCSQGDDGDDGDDGAYYDQAIPQKSALDGGYSDDPSVASGYPSKQAAGSYYDEPSVASGYPSKGGAASYYDDQSVASGYPSKGAGGTSYYDDKSVASGYPSKPKAGSHFDGQRSVASGYPRKPKKGNYDEPSVVSGYHEGAHQSYYDDDPSVVSDYYPRKPKPNYDMEDSYAEHYPQKPK
jgi:hypothetical protein